METNIRIKNFHCIGCINRIESTLKALGVKHFDFDFHLKVANISYDEQHIQPEEMIDAIRELGYEATIRPY